MKIKLVSSKSNIHGWQSYSSHNDSLILEREFFVISIDIDSDFLLEGLGKDRFYRYWLVNEDGEPVSAPIDCFEIIDRTIPDFWQIRNENTYFSPFWKKGLNPYLDSKSTSYTFLGPEGWNPDFWADYHDGYFEARVKFYTEYQKLYNEKIIISNIIKFPSDDFKAICKEKKAYLKPTEAPLKFDFAIEGDKLFSEKEFALTIGKEYKVTEFRNPEDYWYKILNDNRKEFFYPKFIFEELSLGT